MEKIELGDLVRDTVTGFTGKVMARTDWLNGCARLTIQCTDLDKDGKPMDLQTFDEMQVELASKKKPEVKISTGYPGGPRDDASALKRD